MIILLMGFLYFENHAVQITKLDIKCNKLPNRFKEYKILHLSDLHSKSFGKNQRNLVNKIQQLNPDIIVITGDLVDSKKYDEQNSIVLLEQIINIAPVYFVTGNHEWWSNQFDSLENRMNQLGVKVLRNSTEKVTRDKQQIYILGVDDPAANFSIDGGELTFTENLKSINKGLSSDDFKILLSHRPEQMPFYSAEGFDLILSGHAHGGQVRLPFIGGFIAPNQGLFPKYSAQKLY